MQRDDLFIAPTLPNDKGAEDQTDIPLISPSRPDCDVSQLCTYFIDSATIVIHKPRLSRCRKFGNDIKAGPCWSPKKGKPHSRELVRKREDTRVTWSGQSKGITGTALPACSPPWSPGSSAAIHTAPETSPSQRRPLPAWPPGPARAAKT
eukprot:scaffold83026_cov25-Prasinocladus_malaysianus.AAC.3